jgi:LuxR family maltose regulon positive regulatory protein
MGMAQGLAAGQRQLKPVSSFTTGGTAECANLLGTAELHLALSEIRYEQGDLEALVSYCKGASPCVSRFRYSGADYLWWLVKAQLTAAQGDLDTALDQLHEAARLYRAIARARMCARVEALKVRWWLRTGSNWLKR